jgi:membrane-associated protein
MDTLGLGLVLVIGLLLVKESGVPVPIPGDLLVIGLGVAAAEGQVVPVVALLGAIVATIVGGTIQFGLVRGPGRRAVLALLRRFGVGEDRIDRQAERFRRRGTSAVAIARMTPGVRIVAVAAAALAAVPVARFVAGLAVGNSVFTTGHFALGMAFGAAAGGIMASLFVPIVLAVGVAVLGLAGWSWIQRRRGSSRPPVLAWADACCPACLVLGAADLSEGRSASAG